MSSENSDSSLPESEAELWSGHTSQWVHFWYYSLCVLLVAAALGAAPFTAGLSAIGLVVPLAIFGIRWWTNRATSYVLTNQRLRITRGILNRRLDEIELYRVKDYVMEQPLLLRMLGLGNLTLLTSDATTPSLCIPAIANVEAVREKLRTAVQHERDRKRVRELDVDDSSPLS